MCSISAAAVRRLSRCSEPGLLLAGVGGLLCCGGFFLPKRTGAQASCSPGSSRAPASAVVAHGLSCPEACDLPRQEVEPCVPWYWQMDSYPLTTREAPVVSKVTLVLNALHVIITLTKAALMSVEIEPKEMLML